MKTIDLSRIKPCSCEDGSHESTYVETDLNGKLFKISCSDCDDEISFNNTDNIVEEWNNKEPDIIVYYDPRTDKVFGYYYCDDEGDVFFDAPVWVEDLNFQARRQTKVIKLGVL